jgi:putative hemolysin
MAGIWLNLLVVLVLLIIGGLFTATELALVSLRPGERDELRGRGGRGARVARLAGQPTRFLGAVQIGSIVAGFFAAAYATATLAEPLGDAMGRSGLGDDGGETLAVLIVTLATTFLALIVAELTPRRYSMQRPKSVAWLLGPPLDRLASFFRPVIWLLEKCTNGLLRMLGVNPGQARAEMSVEEVRELVLAHEEVPEQEKSIIRQVFAAGDRAIRQAMIPRANVDFLAASMSVEQARHAAWEHTHTRYPVNDGSPDDATGRVTGFLHVRDLFAPGLEPGAPIRGLVRPITAYPPNKKLLAVLSEMQSGAEQIAAVVDEYGAVMGMVTLEDVVEELVGEMYDEYDKVPAAPAGPAGAIVVDGLTSVSDFARRTGVALPAGRYDTVGGFLLASLDRTPRPGDAVEVSGHRLTVATVDGWRVGEVTVQPLPTPDGGL